MKYVTFAVCRKNAGEAGSQQVDQVRSMSTVYRSICSITYSMVMVVFVTFMLVAGNATAADEVEARSDAFFGADVVYNVLNIERAGAEFNPLTVRLRLGIDVFPDIIPSIALESHFMFDLTEDEQDVGGQTAAIKIDHAASILARPYFELSDVVVLYGLVGFTVAQIQGDTQIMGKDDTESGFSIGVGAQFELPFEINGNVEASQLITGDKVDLFALSFGISIPL